MADDTIANFPAKQQEKDLGFIEPCYVQDTFLSGLAFTEEVSPDVFRIVLYTDQRCIFTGERERVVSNKMVMHRNAVVSLVHALAKQTGIKPQDLMYR